MCLASTGSMAMSLTMFLYGAFVFVGSSSAPGFGMNEFVHAPDIGPVVECHQMPRDVAAQTFPLAKRSWLIVVDSSSVPPTRLPGCENVPVRGFASRYTPVPAYEVPPVFASPVAYHSAPEPSSSTVPDESEGS